MTLLHQRRRRLIADDSLSDGDDEAELRVGGQGREPGSRDEHGASSRSYAAGTPLDRGQRLHELFPSRYLSIALLAISGLLAAAALEVLHVWTRSLADALVVKPEEVAALDLGAPLNVSHWLAGILLGVASLVAVFIYSLRRHRLDDYHGRYRVWLWTAGACLLASLGETSSVGSLGVGICDRIAQACGLADSIIWPLVLGTAVSGLVVRLLIEVRRCRLAAGTLILAATGWLVALAVGYEQVAVASPGIRPLIERGSWLAGHVFAVTALLLYTRHVMREIAGLIAAPPVKVKRKKRKPAPVDPPKEAVGQAPKQASNARTDLDPVRTSAGSTPINRSQVTAGSSAVIRRDAAHVEAEPDRNLSRAERKRLRREGRRSA